MITIIFFWKFIKRWLTRHILLSIFSHYSMFHHLFHTHNLQRYKWTHFSHCTVLYVILSSSKSVIKGPAGDSSGKHLSTHLKG